MVEGGAVLAGLKLLAVIGLVLANGFFVAAEFSLVAVRRSRVDELVAEGRVGAARLKRAVDQLDSHLAATQLGITMSSLSLGWIGEPALAALIEPLFAGLTGNLAWLATHTVAVLIAFSIITTLHIVLGELMPKSVALQRPELTALATVGPLRVYLIVFWPVIAALNGFGNRLLRVIGLQPGSGEELLHSPEELRMLVSASQGAGMLHRTQHEVVDRVFSLQRRKISGCLTPRSEIEWLDLEADAQTWREIASASEHSRLLVSRGVVDDVVGFVRGKDILSTAMLDVTILEKMAVARPVPALPEAASVLTTFEDFRTSGAEISIVVDEYGEFLGVITLTNLLEAFVGDLPEAGDVGNLAPTRREDGSWILDGMLSIDELKRLLGLRALPPKAGVGYNTLAGFVLQLLRRLPQPGETACWEGLSFKVAEMDGQRIRRVVVSSLEPRQSDQSTDLLHDEHAETGARASSSESVSGSRGGVSTRRSRRPVP